MNIFPVIYSLKLTLICCELELCGFLLAHKLCFLRGVKTFFYLKESKYFLL